MSRRDSEENKMENKFNKNNTEGYTPKQLQDLNDRYDLQIQNLDPESINYADACQNLAERIETSVV